MDLLLLGAMAVVLIALTVWLVWRPSTETARQEANSAMTPMGDQFEDQYTSATGDLSAGGVAVTSAAQAEEAPGTEPVAEPPAAWPEAAVGPAESAAVVPRPLEPHIHSEEETRAPTKPSAIRLGGAAAVSLGGAALGAWLFGRWQRERNKPINRLRRRLR